MNINKIYVILICVFLSIQVTAQEFFPASDKEAVIQAIRQQSQSTQTLSCAFVQEKHLEMLEEVLESHGQFLFKKENSVRWEYLEPIRYTILIHGGKFTIDNDGKISEFSTESNPMFREINKMIVTAIRGDFVGNSDFEPAYFESQTDYMAKLVPSSAQVQSMIESISIYFDKTSMNVEQVIFSEPGDDFTSIKFSDIQVNKPLPDESFIQP